MHGVETRAGKCRHQSHASMEGHAFAATFRAVAADLQEGIGGAESRGGRRIYG